MKQHLHHPATKVCPLCKQSGRQEFNHLLSTCTYVPESDRRFIAKARHIMSIVDSDNESDITDDCPGEPISPLETGTHPGSEPTIRRINIASSPYLDVFCGHQTVRITLDTGAMGNMIQEAAAIRLGAKISRSSQSTRQAGGFSPLEIVGETRLVITRENKNFTFVVDVSGGG